ncbi:MAG: FKBP-type peptidyl-prolyl cis-trans isomerase [Gemmatimonadota bacterium]
MSRLRAALLIIALVACGRPDAGGSSAEGSATTGERARGEIKHDFAEELGVNLASMTRTASGLYYRDLAAGRGLDARPGHVVVIRYTEWLPNGARVSGHDRLDFPLGGGRVIAGWEEGITGMRIGGRRQLVIPPHLAYGSRGRGEIPPNATLIMDVELLEIRM